MSADGQFIFSPPQKYDLTPILVTRIFALEV